MQPLVRKEITLKQKILGSLVFALAVFLPFAFYSNVLINNNVKFPLIVTTIIASVLTIIFLIRELLDETSTLRKYMKKRGERPILFLFIFSFLTLTFLYFSISVGIPSALHMLVSEPGELVVTIKSKPPSYSNRNPRGSGHSPGSVSVEEYTYLNNQVDGISKTDWDSLVPGDKLRLIGKKSYFGFSYDKYEKLTSR